MTNRESTELAWQHLREGHPREAYALFDQVLKHDSNYVDALHGMGVLAYQARDLDAAGNLLALVLKRDPKRADAHMHLALVRVDTGRPRDAERELRAAIDLEPKRAQFRAMLAALLQQVGDIPGAIREFRTAVDLDPNHALHLIGYSHALVLAGDLDAAEAAARRAIEIDPKLAQAHVKLGYATMRRGDVAAAVPMFRTAIELDPDDETAHVDLGLALLLTGQLEEGFAEYEWRFRNPAVPVRMMKVDKPAWDGSDLNGRTLLVQAEQGLGDTVQFCRFVPLIASGGAKVIVSCDPRLIPLLKTLLGAAEVISNSSDSVPAVDVQAPMLSLGRLCRTRLETIPSEVPYLSVDDQKLKQWGERLGAKPRGTRRVGLVWAGNPRNPNDRSRSIEATVLAPLAQIPGVTWVAMQVGAAGGPPPAPPFPMLEIGRELRDFADTAAVISHLDLLISVDSAPAHTAGALARPVWTLLPHFPDWRWLLDRNDSPWYPTMRLFRQPAPDDWRPVIAEVAEALRAFVATRKNV